MSFPYVSSNSSPSVNSTVQQSQPANRYTSLIRYELLVLIVWFFIECARACAISKMTMTTEKDEKGQDKTPSTSTGNSSVSTRFGRFNKLSLYILIGAAVGTFVYWLITEFWFYDKFHSMEKVNSINVPEGWSDKSDNGSVNSNQWYDFPSSSSSSGAANTPSQKRNVNIYDNLNRF